MVRSGKAAIGIAHEPGAIECPSERAAIGGRPRTLTKLLRGTALAGPTLMARTVFAAGAAEIDGGTVKTTRCVFCGQAGLAASAQTMAAAIEAKRRSVATLCLFLEIARSGSRRIMACLALSMPPEAARAAQGHLRTVTATLASAFLPTP
jgi:hypothetical protein